MKKHIYTVHEGHKDYKCESCGKSFAEAGSLRKHIHRIHEGHKDHKCESCGKSFSQAGNLKIHIHTVHEGHKDYKCESCGKSFSQAGTLKAKKLEMFFETFSSEPLDPKLSLKTMISKFEIFDPLFN